MTARSFLLDGYPQFHAAFSYVSFIITLIIPNFDVVAYTFCTLLVLFVDHASS